MEKMKNSGNMEQIESQTDATIMPKSSSSSSRRKRRFPQKQISADIYDGFEENRILIKKLEPTKEVLQNDDEESKSPASQWAVVEKIDESHAATVVQPPTNSQSFFLNLMNNSSLSSAQKNGLQHFLEVQQQIQINNSNNQQSHQKITAEFLNKILEKVQSPASFNQFRPENAQQYISHLCHTFKDEIEKLMDNILGYCSRESRAVSERMLISAANKIQQQQYFAMAESVLMAKNFNSTNSSNKSLNSCFSFASLFANGAMTNSFVGDEDNFNQATTMPPTSCNSIFPTSTQSSPSLSIFPILLSLLNNNNSFTPMLQNYNTRDIEYSPIPKKRARIFDNAKTNPKTLFSSKPLFLEINNSFPPTMVHPLSINSLIAGEDSNAHIHSCNFNESSDDNSNNSSLTAAHLRKAKLIFLYSRYPSLALLEEYFPDIPFNNQNKKHLIKWYSNFREFFFLQIEKYAKKAIVAGIQHRDDIRVTKESEIYKAINQHFNRYNFLKPPPSFGIVIEESLKEFFVAIQQRLDFKPSWKKPIYKIIREMDDPIPEDFKHPNFIPNLE